MSQEISIITVVLNDADGLKRTINSIKKISDVNVEHIIVDGGSSDGSAQLAHDYSSIRVPSKNDGGIYPAMQRGASQATKKWLIFCNAGDELFDGEALKKLLQLLDSRPDIKWAFGPIIENSLRGTSNLITNSSDNLSEYIFSRKCYVPFPSVLIHRSFFLELGGFSNHYRIAGDFELIVKMAKISNAFQYSMPIAVFSAGGISYQKADLAWREEIKIRISLLHLKPLEIIYEYIKYFLKFFKWRLGKFLDLSQKLLLPNKEHWRDIRFKYKD